uniref:Secreted protein n=1 Tax=Steinernema glaseri TaxID=37863 RepID=A0A1I7YRF8_9BILA
VVLLKILFIVHVASIVVATAHIPDIVVANVLFASLLHAASLDAATSSARFRHGDCGHTLDIYVRAKT